MQITRPLGFSMPPKIKDNPNFDGFEIPLYKGWLYVEFGDIPQILKDFKQESGEEEKQIAGRACQLNSHNWLIALDFGTIKRPSIWAHEAVHIANMIFSSRGVTYTLENDEHLCYLVTWIVECIEQKANAQ